MAGRITINTEKCKGCGLCVVVCPRSSIVRCEQSNSKGYYPPRSANGDCSGCCKCAVVCPDAAIKVEREKSDQIKMAGHHSKNRGVSLVEGRV